MKNSKADLSSLAAVPITDGTRAELDEAGIDEADYEGMSELGARNILLIRGRESGVEGLPSCYRQDYDPADDFCGGCVHSPSCWSGDGRYVGLLRSGKAGPPCGVPAHVVEARLGDPERTPPAPPARKAPPSPVRRPPPPPTRGS